MMEVMYESYRKFYSESVRVVDKVSLCDCSVTCALIDS